VDTDKGAIEIEVFDDGVIERLLIEPGQKTPVGTVLALIRAPGEAPGARPSTGWQARRRPRRDAFVSHPRRARRRSSCTSTSIRWKGVALADRLRSPMSSAPRRPESKAHS
jgi:pyruvate/2-oxoglutarate dehydrogenase complex dihydrolipoamide acyltransferase (E2) component